jgi:hypothetical protein
LLSIHERIGGADNNFVRVTEAGNNFDGGAEIAAQDNRDKFGAVAIFDSGDLQALRAKN